MDVKKALAEVKEETAGYAIRGDTVSWTAFREDGTELGRWENEACFAPLLRNTSTAGDVEIHCKSGHAGKGGSMPCRDFQEFFRLCKETGLVPPGVEATIKDRGNYLTIPRDGWDRHTIYITLCLYRQCDIRPDEVMTALGLYKRLKPEGTTFLQILHYLAATTTISSGHVFMNLSPYGGGSKLDLSHGGALVWFTRLSKAQRAGTVKGEGFDSYTKDMLKKQAGTLSMPKVDHVSGFLDP
jgi:hypothetical protein